MTNLVRLIKTEYENSDNAVIEASVKDFGAVGDGIEDDTKAFKDALEYMESRGGILYAPKGVYKLTSEMTIPEGVTILGDFINPTIENPKVQGTVLALYPKSCEEGNNTPFFLVKHASSLDGLTFWYPQQKFVNGKPIEYPFTVQTIVLPSTLQNLNFINSYRAISQDVLDDYTIQQMVRNIYGTPLLCGFWFDCAPDVCRQLGFDYRPDWWLNSGLANIPDENELKKWLYNNATAFDLGRIDWHYVGDITVRGYNIGVRIRSGFGRAYNIDAKNCKICFQVDYITYYGLQMFDCKLSATDSDDAVAMKISAVQEENGLTVNNSTIESVGTAIEIDKNAIVSIQDSEIKGKLGVNLLLGRCHIVNSKLNCDTLAVSKDKAKCVFTNCLNKNRDKISADTEVYTASYDEENVNIILDRKKLFERKLALKVRNPQVANRKVVFAADFGVCDGGEDIADKLQAAIDNAAENGGGIVYVPAGEYRIESPVTVKEGVELRGTTGFFHYVIGKTAYFITDYGRGDEKAPALFTLEKNSGLRGISVSYDKINRENIGEFAPTIRCMGENIFIVGVSVTCGWWIADLSTHRCDNHYIDSLNFCSFKTGITVGSGSQNGVIMNAHSNPGEIWDNPYTDRDHWISEYGKGVQQYTCENVTGFYIGESENETIYMSFIFGTLYGVHIDDGAKDLYVISHGVDFSSVCYYLTGYSTSTIIDNQIVGTWFKGENKSTGISATETFTGVIDLYNLCPWNIYDSAIRLNNGTVNVNGGIFFESGDFGVLALKGTANVSGVVFLRRFRNDFTSLGEETEICAFGNTHVSTPYAFNKSTKLKGSDIKNYYL